MEGFAFVTKEPLLGPVVLALRVDVPGRKEQLWLGEEQDVEAALRGKERPLFLAQTRPLGAFWCEDVYKRQGWACFFAAFGCWAGCLEAFSDTATGSVSFFIPVSYTHLDVYKRQD